MLSRAELKQQAKEQLKGNVGSLLLIFLVYVGVAVAFMFALSFILSMVAINSSEAAAVVVVIAMFVAIFVVISPLAMGLYKVFLNVTYGDKPAVGTLFEGFKPPMFGKSIMLYLLMYIFICLWSMLLYIPGIIKSFSYSMSWYILAENPDMTAREAITESRLIMDGHKFELFVLYLSFIPWILLSYVTFGIALIWVLPYMQLTMTNFYHNIKRQSSVQVYETTAEDVKEVDILMN